jgi:hypothetical protein
MNTEPYRSAPSSQEQAAAALEKAIVLLGAAQASMRGGSVEKLTPELLRKLGEAFRSAGEAMIAKARAMENA